MKKLKFIFEDGGNVVYDKSLEYETRDDHICFSLDGAEYTFKFGSDFEFKRSTEEGIMTLKRESCTYKIPGADVEVEIAILYFAMKKNDKNYLIEYNIESDEEKRKKIILSFD